MSLARCKQTEETKIGETAESHNEFRVYCNEMGAKSDHLRGVINKVEEKNMRGKTPTNAEA